MYYINPTPSESGNYGNPHYPANEGDIFLPDTFLAQYAECKGFVTLTIENGGIVAVTRNDEAYNAYMAEHPDRPAPPTEMERLEAQILYTALMTDTLIEEE